MNLWRAFSNGIINFFFRPASPRPLAALRIGLGSVMLLQAWVTHSAVWDLFSSQGIVQGEVATTLNRPELPQLMQLQAWLARIGISEQSCILLVGFCYVVALVFLTVGWRTRLAALAAWFLHWILMNSADYTLYGVDTYAHVFLFYLMWVPAGAAWSVESWRKGVVPLPTPGNRFALRVLQLHLAVTYLISGYEKAQGPQWWNGELLWRAVSLPIYQQYNMSWLAWWPTLSMLSGWGDVGAGTRIYNFYLAACDAQTLDCGNCGTACWHHGFLGPPFIWLDYGDVNGLFIWFFS